MRALPVAQALVRTALRQLDVAGELCPDAAPADRDTLEERLAEALREAVELLLLLARGGELSRLEEVVESPLVDLRRELSMDAADRHELASDRQALIEVPHVELSDVACEQCRDEQV